MLSRQDSFALPSFAKINLSLRVLGRRADGYHELRTVFQTISLRDRLTFRESDGSTLELVCDNCASEGVPTDDSNLVARAARLLRERFNVTRGARVALEKIIPAGGGLGGGSSNAAVALIGLARLWRIETTREELTELGASLGADVPFFFTGGTALGTGRGDRVAPLEDAARSCLVVIAPRVKISTAEAFRALRAPALTKDFAPVNLLVSRGGSNFSDSLRAGLANDFEPAIFSRHPEVARARDALTEAGATAALLTGSGSSVFGVFENQGGAERARESLRVEDGWRVFACETVSRDEYRSAFGACARFL
ncbi:MAG: 4-(cytidine 5'-diphospho)-2-C-methyl-D-erythritol kinase [Acidobacteria bacterium]|nr:4-(cytidine 5'-diphospho)-2-C-methyl-D-erythritol kinase [Acidobacteriota bacterium]